MKLLFVILSAFASVAIADTVVDVPSLNKLLQNTHAGWVAKSSSIGKMNISDTRHFLGLRRDSGNDVQFINPNAAIMSDLPPSIDWRNKSGVNWVSPLLDQANCGSCVAFASIATLETQFKIASGRADFNIRLSPQNLFACGGGMCDYGWMPESAARYLLKSGVPDEACHPYVSGATGQDVACRASCSDVAQRTLRISSYTTPSRGQTDLSAVKQALLKGPLVTTLSVYADFMVYGSGVYKHVTGDYLGGHAVSIVGYDDALGAFIIRNSWGESWGENGFAHVSYADISGIGDETWLYDVPVAQGAVSVENPIDYAYASGELNVKAISTYPATDSVSVSIFKEGKAVWNNSSQGFSSTKRIDATTLADGRYEVQAVAMNSNGVKLGSSTRQFFYIANQQPALALSFEGTKGANLSQPLKARIEMAVTATSTTVPMSSVEFHSLGPDGKEAVRIARVVVDGLTIGWRTNLVPNGTYEIWMVGHVKTNSMDTIIESSHQTVQLSN